MIAKGQRRALDIEWDENALPSKQTNLANGATQDRSDEVFGAARLGDPSEATNNLGRPASRLHEACLGNASGYGGPMNPSRQTYAGDHVQPCPSAPFTQGPRLWPLRRVHSMALSRRAAAAGRPSRALSLDFAVRQQRTSAAIGSWCQRRTGANAGETQA